MASGYRQDGVRMTPPGPEGISNEPLGLILTRDRLHIKDKMLYKVQT